MDELSAIIEKLAGEEQLEGKHREHALSGGWKHHRECHIRPDWLLIYKLEPGRLILVRTGTHSELFG
jgi:mRNA interferase YafQ